jgi:hypothetical protein|tara:strand:+ start:22716 stop:23813 length:1098 start_codon:yes stop_codon:yes gene_type:complete
MARTYAEFTTLVRDWSNKDSSVLPDVKIQEAMRYAADKCYRRLRVAALEQSITYNSTALTAATTEGNGYVPSKTELTLPADLIEFIQIREIDTLGRTCRLFNEKTDLRTYNDYYAEKYDYLAYWSRTGNTLLLSPGFNKGAGIGTPDKVELHYYKRLPALDALYDVTPANYSVDFLTASTAAGSSFLYCADSAVDTKYATHAEAVTADATKITAKINVAVSSSATITNDGRSAGTIANGMELSGAGVTLNASTGAPPLVTNASTQNSIVVDTAQSLDDNADITFSNTTSTKYIGNLVSNWLRDENERVLLMGALTEIFAYVQDDDQSGKYKQLFNEEVLELNNEDATRNASGGNIQVTYNGRGMI